MFLTRPRYNNIIKKTTMFYFNMIAIFLQDLLKIYQYYDFNEQDYDILT